MCRSTRPQPPILRMRIKCWKTIVWTFGINKVKYESSLLDWLYTASHTRRFMYVTAILLKPKGLRGRKKLWSGGSLPILPERGNSPMTFHALNKAGHTSQDVPNANDSRDETEKTSQMMDKCLWIAITRVRQSRWFTSVELRMIWFKPVGSFRGS